MKPPVLLFFALAACLLALAARPLCAQTADYEREPQGLEQDFLLRVWETADGLLPTNVRSIAQTPDGYLWLAAFDGFVRFDGVRAAVISGKNVAGLPAVPKVTRLFADASGRLWGATLEGRLFSSDGSGWQEYGEAQGLPRLAVEAISEGPGGALIFSGEKRVLRFNAGRFSEMALPELPKDFRPPLKAMYGDRGTLWLASATHVWRAEGSGWKLIVPPANPSSRIRGTALGRDSGIWIATDRELRKYESETLVKTLARPPDFQGDNVEMLEDFHGNLWVGGANSGLRIWMADGRVVTASVNAESLSAQITSLFEDRERNVLVGTAGAGVARFKPRPFAVWFGRLGGLVGTIVNSICEEAPGRILVGTEGSGLRRISHDQPPTVVVSPDGALGPKQRVTSLVRSRDGTVLAAIAGKGLFRVEGEGAVALPVKLLEGSLVRSMFEDSQGRLWVGHDRGVLVRRGETFELVATSDGAGLSNVRGICEDREGTMWFTAAEGLARVRGDKLERVPVPEAPPKRNLLGIYADAQGAVWIGVESAGILRLQAGRAFLFTGEHGLPVTSPGAFLEEGQSLWLSGEKGLVRVSRASFDAVAEGRASRLELQLFNRADGLPSDAFRRGYQPAVLRASDGELWFASHKGATAVRPAEILTAAYEPPPIIEEIRAELQLILVTEANRGRIEVPAGTRHMSIRVSIPSLGKPEYARFQYRLEGFDGIWHDAGSERVIRFYDLQPGSYRFHVRAIGTDGRFVETQASVALVVHPFYWQRLWFRAVCLLALLGLVAAVVWRSQQARIRRQEEKLLEQEARTRLEAQLQQSQKMEAIGRLAGGIAHDFNNLLTTVSGNAELLQLELGEKSAQYGIAEDISTAAARARELIGQILTFSRHRPVERRAVDLAPVIREALQLLRAGFPAMLEVSAEVPATLPLILADVAQIQRVVMNLGTNAAHAVGSIKGRIVVRAEECAVADRGGPVGVPPGRYLCLTVADNGRGMDDETLKRIFDPFFTTKGVGEGTGLGLSVVHGIVEAHDGFTTVESRPHAGTTFQIYLPVTEQAAEPGGESPPPSTSTGSGETILLVDDEDSVLKLTRAMLEKLGYTVYALADPAVALTVFAAEPSRYRLVITDFAMPAFDGVELARRVWEKQPGFPIILYSGYGSSLTPEEAVKMGFAQLVAKPFTLHDLAAAVAQALQDSEERRSVPPPDVRPGVRGA